MKYMMCLLMEAIVCSSFLLRKRNDAKKVALYICKFLYAMPPKGRVLLRLFLLMTLHKGPVVTGSVPLIGGYAISSSGFALTL